MTNSKIQTLVLDVDGVINGSIEGINTPFPSKAVIFALQKLLSAGKLLVLCTSKGVYPIVEMVNKYNLSGVHIADAGGVIYNSINSSYQTNCLTEIQANEIIKVLEKSNNYFEVYTPTNWYVPEKFNVKYIHAHTELLRKKPVKQKSLSSLRFRDVSKIVCFIEDSPESDNSKLLISQFADYSVKWTVSPVLKPANLLIITKKGVSKKDALQSLAKQQNFSLNKCLGVGDHHSDWKFMSICGFRGVMGNSTAELVQIAKKEQPATVAFGKGVDQDGILDIFKKFDLI